jgi:hypothetical protein
MFKRAAEAVGLHYRLIAKPSFEEAVAAIRQGEAEVLVAAVRTPGANGTPSSSGPTTLSLRPSSAASAMGGHP